jgi:hypothetical protein
MVEHHNYLYLETIGGQSFNFSFNAVVLQIVVTVTNIRQGFGILEGTKSLAKFNHSIAAKIFLLCLEPLFR